jgi:hypothetical protein
VRTSSSERSSPPPSPLPPPPPAPWSAPPSVPTATAASAASAPSFRASLGPGRGVLPLSDERTERGVSLSVSTSATSSDPGLCASAAASSPCRGAAAAAASVFSRTVLFSRSTTHATGTTCGGAAGGSEYAGTGARGGGENCSSSSSRSFCRAVSHPGEACEVIRRRPFAVQRVQCLTSLQCPNESSADPQATIKIGLPCPLSKRGFRVHTPTLRRVPKGLSDDTYWWQVLRRIVEILLSGRLWARSQVQVLVCRRPQSRRRHHRYHEARELWRRWHLAQRRRSRLGGAACLQRRLQLCVRASSDAE